MSAALAGVVLVSSAAACGDADRSTLTSVHERGFVRVAYAQEPPYAFLDADGTVRGESPLALRGALAVLGVDSVRWTRMDFGELLPSLAAGGVDVVASGLFSTGTRLDRVRFTRPTSCARAALLVRQDGPAPDGLDAFQSPEAGAVAVLRGSVEQAAAAEIGLPDDRVVVVPDVATGVASVREGRADALAMTEHSLRRSVESLGSSGLRWYTYEPSPAIEELVEGCSALAVRGEDDALLAALDSGLAMFVGSPEHRAGLDALGLSDAEIPGKPESAGSGGRALPREQKVGGLPGQVPNP